MPELTAEPEVQKSNKVRNTLLIAGGIAAIVGAAVAIGATLKPAEETPES